MHRKTVASMSIFSDCSLAMMVIKLVVATLVWHFNIELAYEGQNEPAYEDGFFTIRGPLPLRISPVLRD